MQKLLLKVVAKTAPIIGGIHMPYSRKLITGDDYYKACEVVKPGYIFATKTRGEFGNLMIPGFWSHIAIVSTCGEYVIEATGEGVHKTNLVDFLMKKDYAIALRAKFLSGDERFSAAAYAENQVGKRYDFGFSTTTEQFYCSELAYQAFKNAKPDMPMELRKRAGNLTVIPQDFENAKEMFEIVWQCHSILALS